MSTQSVVGVMMISLAVLAIACGSNDDGKVTVSCDPSPCFDECRSTRDRANCEAAGGQWEYAGLTGRRTCFCPTSDAGMPCTSSSQCQGLCIGDPADCRGEGTCADEDPKYGCFCWVRNGAGLRYCFD